MVALAGFTARIIVDTFHLSTVLSGFEPATDVAMLDATVLTSDSKQFVPGITGSKLTANGFLDTADSSGHLDFLDGWLTSAPLPLTAGMAGLAEGSPLWLTGATESSFTTTTAAAAIVGFNLEAQTNGRLDIGVSLHDLTAETGDASGGAVNGGAASSAGGIGHLHVVEYDGLDDATVIIEGSANGTTGWATLLTFATVTDVASERQQIAGSVHQYLRASVDVTGTGSLTYQCGFARL